MNGKMRKIALTMIVLVAACGDNVHCPGVKSHGLYHTVAWSVGASDSPGVPDPVVCTDVVSHPCPWLLYTHALAVENGEVRWTDASGGANDIGVDASAYPDVVEAITVGDVGDLDLPMRGDDGGLRRAFVLAPTPEGGWEGNATWALFNVAGSTTFHVSVAP